MKELKAIYLPDLAFDNSNINCLFKYNKENDMFEMESNTDYKYESICVIEDDDFIVFLTELIEENDKSETFFYGKVKQVSKDDILNVLKVI